MKLKSSYINIPNSDIIWDGAVFKVIPQTQLIVKASVINGKYDGLYQEFYIDEKLRGEDLERLLKGVSTIEKLQEEGKRVLGNLRQQKVFDNGIVNGVDTTYSKSGNILIREYYITGVRVEKAVYAAYIGEVLAEVENIGIISDIAGGILAQYLH
jgi:antitoxin component YwqK of YwqJK toxin-antitoxin module